MATLLDSTEQTVSILTENSIGQAGPNTLMLHPKEEHLFQWAGVLRRAQFLKVQTLCLNWLPLQLLQ